MKHLKVNMNCIMIICVTIFICSVNGFLLNDRTNPPNTEIPTISDHHYSALLNMLLSEREDRLKLEGKVSQLQKELSTTQRGVTDLYNDQRNDTETLNQQVNVLKDIQDKYIRLQKKYDSLKVDFDGLQQNCGSNENKTKSLEMEIASLKQLKTVSNLQSIVKIQNETKLLEKELKLTNDKLNSITVDVNARKQDFIALFSKADTTERNLKSSIKSFQLNLNSSESKLTNYIDTKVNAVEVKAKAIGRNLNSSFQMLENYVDTKINAAQVNQKAQLSLFGNSQNQTNNRIEQEIRNLQQEVHKQPNRVAVSAGASGKTYSDGSTVLFPNVYTTHGISSSSVSTLGTTGIFTCTRPGLYLITVFIMTSTHSTQANVYKNNSVIGYILFSLNGWYQTNSVTVLEHVSVNDTIYIKVYNNMVVHNGRNSVISILQITG